MEKQNIFQSKTIYIIIALFVTLLIRIPFLLDDISFNNDAPKYSENIEKRFFDKTYDVHMPGYISYIYSGRFIYFFIKDPTVTQHVINMILIFLITFIFFKLLELLGFRIHEAFIFTIMFSFNNILLLGSITGGNRLFLTLCSIILIYLSIKIINDQQRELIVFFAIFFAFFIGFRQDISFYFFPLYIYLFFKVKSLKFILISLFCFTIVCLSWFIPLMIEYGGISSYLSKIRNYQPLYNTSIILSGLKFSPFINMARVFVYILNAFLFIIPIFIYSLVKRQFSISKKIAWIFAFSFFPAFLFQLLVHNGNFVHLASFMTPFFLFLITNFRINNKRKIIFFTVIIFFILFQFFGIRMFKSDNYYKKIANVLWLQYSYDGAKSGNTLRLKMLEEEYKSSE
ncbi:MAG: hypothetical protein KAT05_14225 [Spirochaetes bacterium]|nr:hypothetical protein [Spirochaetota bacterium]